MHHKLKSFSYLMILFSLLTTSLFADTVNSIAGPALITHEETVTLEVDYVADEDRVLVVYLKTTTGEKKLYFYKRIIVDAGAEIEQVTFDVPADTPLIATYKYGAYIAPVGKYFKDNLGKAYQHNVQVVSGHTEDTVLTLNGPAVITQGERVVLDFDYIASQKRDLVVYLKTTTGDKTLYFYKRLAVFSGPRIGIVAFNVPNDAPTDATYKYGAYIAPIGGKFGSNLGKAYQYDVHVESADTNENQPLTREELIQLIANWADNSSVENADLIINANTSQITDMSELFETYIDEEEDEIYGPDLRNFNLDISGWDVSNVTNMSYMFDNATAFNQPLDSWDVSNVTNMLYMFKDAAVFNQPLDSWDVSNVTSISNMFSYAVAFNQPLNSWDVSNVTGMVAMFRGAAVFNQPLDSWDVSSVTNMDQMFSRTDAFNQPLDSWDVSNVTGMYSMFSYTAVFNQPLDSWDVSNVIILGSMFSNAAVFNQPLDSWDVSNVTNMYAMFRGAAVFNQDISHWDVSNVNVSRAFSVGSALQDSYNPFK